MKPEVFLQALNDVDDRYIEEAVKNCRPKTHMQLWRGIAIAACACLAATAVMALIGNHLMDSPDKSARSASEEMFYEEGAYKNAVYEEAAYEEAEYDAPMAVSDTFSDYASITEHANMASAAGTEAETAAEMAQEEQVQGKSWKGALEGSPMDLQVPSGYISCLFAVWEI